MKTIFRSIAVLVLSTSTIMASAANNDKNEIPSCDAARLVRVAFGKVNNNYPANSTYMNAAYKETLKKDGNMVAINEVMLNIQKASYKTSQEDMIMLDRARGNNKQSAEKVAVKLQGGPVNALMIDAVKNPFLGCELSEICDTYDFEYSDNEVIDGKVFHVVNFDQKYFGPEVYYRGKIYIDSKSLAISKIEFNMNVEHNQGAIDFFVKKKPSNMNIRILSAKYTVNYKEKDNKWYLADSNTDIRMRVSPTPEQYGAVYTISSNLEVKHISNTLAEFEKGNLITKDVIVSEMIAGTQPGMWNEFNKMILAQK